MQQCESSICNSIHKSHITGRRCLLLDGNAFRFPPNLWFVLHEPTPFRCQFSYIEEYLSVFHFIISGSGSGNIYPYYSSSGSGSSCRCHATIQIYILYIFHSPSLIYDGPATTDLHTVYLNSLSHFHCCSYTAQVMAEVSPDLTLHRFIHHSLFYFPMSLCLVSTIKLAVTRVSFPLLQLFCTSDG